MLLALSGAQKTGILVVALVFIAFALAASFLLPRRNPDFPTARGMRWFVVASIALFVAMMTAMAVFAREEEEAAGHEPAATETQPGETQPGETEPPATETGEGAAPEGDAEAGSEVFASAGCATCHTLEAAGASGTVGPNLDEGKPDHALVVDRVTNGMGAMPSFEGQLTEQQIDDVAAYVVQSTQ